jgi:hypothetical protein
MKIHIHRARQEGQVFLISMIVTSMVCLISVGSYLSLSSSENAVVMRSLAWNTALPLAEAGVEEALSHITKNTANFAADGWTANGTNYSHPSRALGSGRYSVNIAGSPGSLLTVTSTGYGLWKGTNYASRTVEVRVQSGSTIPRAVGMVAKNGISFNGNLAIDSYDSTNAQHSTNGRYDAAKAGDKALVATPWGFNLGGNSTIAGKVASGPSGSITLGGSAKVGDTAWVNSKNKGLQAGHSTNTFAAAIPDVVAPYTSATAPASGTVSNTSYNYVLNGGNYMATNLNSGGGNTRMIVTAPSVLLVTGAITLEDIVFAPGATLDLYIATPSISFCPEVEGMTSSQTVTPIQFRVWGLSTCTNMDMTGGDSFTGMIYAPQADLRARGNASFYGAFTSSTFNCNGTFDFHYDQATASYTPSGSSFQIVSWAEK